MAEKRPIKVFYIPKQPRNPSTTQQRSVLHALSNGLPLHSKSPSFATINEMTRSESILGSPFERESSLESGSKISSKDSFLSKASYKEEESSKTRCNKRLCLIIAGLIIAVCLIVVVILLGIYLSNKGTSRMFHSFPSLHLQSMQRLPALEQR